MCLQCWHYGNGVESIDVDSVGMHQRMTPITVTQSILSSRSVLLRAAAFVAELASFPVLGVKVTFVKCH